MADIAIFRINYKSDFILTLNSDAGWATPFCIKFWTGAPSQAYFAGYDGTTYTHCAPVDGEPTKLRVQFDDHHLPIGDLKFQIGYHFTVADFPTTVEDEVLNQASVIIEQNGEPAQVMLDFTGETAPEIQFSLPAYANEAHRIANEQQRIENEQARISAENERIANEQQRIENEQARISAENERISNEDARIAEEQVRVSQEAARVSEFAQLKEESQEVTADANAAAQLANEKAAEAQQKAVYAQTQGDYAKAQGDIAQADHTRAESDHTTATADHTQAAADHAQAAADHTRADSDHTRAESDHEAVEVYVDSLGAFDISAYHATGGVLAKYADLTAALGTDGANIPDALRKGGMSVKFVRSSDNKYVQYRLMVDEWSNNVTDWQGVDDEPTPGSNNLVKSGGVEAAIYDLNTDIHGEKFITPTQVLTGSLSASGSYSASDDQHHVVADVSRLAGKNLTISGYYVQWGFLKTYNVPNDSEWATGGRIDVSTKDCINEEIPSDAKFIYVYLSESTTIPTFTVTPLQDGIDGKIKDINDALDIIDGRVDSIDETIDGINGELGLLKSSQLCKVQYYQGTFGTASEKLSIYIPCDGNIIRYDLTHNITANKMKDVWRIQYAYLIVGSTETPITINGEWECAFLINGQNDATGGDLHGYEEIQGDLSVFVDGMLKSASSLSDGKYFNELRIVEATYMYKQDATKVAEHGREYTFNINGMLLRQTLKFVENLLLDNCYMMMLPAAKSLTSKYYTDVDFTVANIASLPIYKDNVKSFSIFGIDFKANIITQEYPEFPATLLIHDNGGGSYNKCYLFAAYNKNVSANTKYESCVLYQISAKPISQETHYADYYPLTQGQTVASNGQPTFSDTYDLVTIILNRNALLWTNWNSALSYTAIGYNGVRYRSSENNLPSSNNPLVVQANTPVYFSCLPQSMDESEIVIQYT